MHAEWIWKNGEFVKWEDATVHVTTHALHYGSSVFEGVRAYATPQGPAVFRLQAHTQRLFNSAKIARIEVPYSEDELTRRLFETVRRNGHDSCYIRPLIFRGAGVLGVEGRKNPTEVVIITMEWGRVSGGGSASNRARMCRSAPGGVLRPILAHRWRKLAGSTSTASSSAWKRTTTASTKASRWTINGTSAKARARISS